MMKEKRKPSQDDGRVVSLITIADTKRYVSQQFEALFDTIQSHYAKKQFIAVTSANDGSGKSTIAGNLAIVSALSHQRTLLVDANIASPIMAKTFDLLNYRGLTHYLSEEDVALPTVLQPSYLLDNLDVLTAGADIDIDTTRLPALFEEMAKYYDCIIFDTATIQSDALTEAILSHVDVSLMVVRKNQSRMRDVKKGVSYLKRLSHNMALVDNGFTYSPK